MAEGCKRCLFQCCPEEVLVGASGEKVLDGAGAAANKKNGPLNVVRGRGRQPALRWAGRTDQRA